MCVYNLCIDTYVYNQSSIFKTGISCDGIFQNRLITLKRKYCNFDEIFITGCTGSCHFDNFHCSQWCKFHQNGDLYSSVLSVGHFVKKTWMKFWSKYKCIWKCCLPNEGHCVQTSFCKLIGIELAPNGNHWFCLAHCFADNCRPGQLPKELFSTVNIPSNKLMVLL